MALPLYPYPFEETREATKSNILSHTQVGMTALSVPFVDSSQSTSRVSRHEFQHLPHRTGQRCIPYYVPGIVQFATPNPSVNESSLLVGTNALVAHHMTSCTPWTEFRQRTKKIPSVPALPQQTRMRHGGTDKHVHTVTPCKRRRTLSICSRRVRGSTVRPSLRFHVQDSRTTRRGNGGFRTKLLRDLQNDRTGDAMFPSEHMCESGLGRYENNIGMSCGVVCSLRWSLEVWQMQESERAQKVLHSKV